MKIAMFHLPDEQIDEKTMSIIEIVRTFPLQPAMKGAGSVDLTCPGCDFVVVQGVRNAGEAQGLVFRCPSCLKYCRTRH